MPERKVWSPEQDKILVLLKEEEKIPKWSLIADKMEKEYQVYGRTGKQCRQRYHNYLDSKIVHDRWNRQEEEALDSLHNQFGNKWSVISQKMKGRSDNCVKNHFYSKMRKGLRKLNRIISEEFKKDFKDIKLKVIYKILQQADKKFKKDSPGTQLTEECMNMKNLLLELSYDEHNHLQKDLARLQKLTSDITAFVSNCYRRKRKNIDVTPKDQEIKQSQNKNSAPLPSSTKIQNQMQKLQKISQKSPIKQEHALCLPSFIKNKQNPNNQHQICFQSQQKSQQPHLFDESQLLSIRVKFEMSEDYQQIKGILEKEGALKFEEEKSNSHFSVGSMRMLEDSIQIRMRDYGGDSFLSEQDRLFFNT